MNANNDTNPYIAIILNGLTDKNPSDSSIVERTIKLLDGQENVNVFIENIRSEISRIKDLRGDREPFYLLYLSIAYLMQKSYKLSKGALADAVQGFQIQGFSQNEALGEWLFGIVHFESGNHERAQRACESATAILSGLIAQCQEESRYKKAEEYTKYLAELRIFYDTVKVTPNSGKDKVSDNEKAQNDDSSDEIFHHEELKKNKPFLQKYYIDLKNRLENLRLQQKRVPPTLVATIFYIYKILIPSHSVYRTIPTPATVREKTAYEELLRRVGSFEVIEQLVEMEQEFLPQASRQELLEKIIRDWDLDIKRQKASGG